MSDRNSPLEKWRFGVKRLRDAFKLFVANRPIDELHLRGPNSSGKTQSSWAYIFACLVKLKELDGVKLPQWEGPIHAVALCLDYPQQKLSVQQTVLGLVGDWPHRARYKSDEILSSLRVKPVDGSDNEADWSQIIFLSEENKDAGTGARADITWFDEPPVMRILRELRKAPHANRRGIIVIGNTPTEIEKWWELAQDYGDTPRSTLRRVDEERAECTWSLHEVADWIHSSEAKAKLRRKYASDPLREAREHGDYIDASGTCPFNVERLKEWLNRVA